MTTLAERAKGTAFEVLYAVKAPPPPMTKEEARRVSQRASAIRCNARRAAKAKAEADNRLKANWTI